jgi:hypothetical protein
LAGGPLKAADFQPRGLLRNPHVQSTLGSLPPRSKDIRQRAASLLANVQPMLLDCGQGVRLQAFYTPLPHSRRAADNRRLAILLHGWEGDVGSPYVLSAAALLYENQWPLVRLNLRDHGGTHGLNPDLFHSCRLPEVVGAVRALAERFPAARPCLGGFSLGGNFMLRVAADADAPDGLAGAVAVSPVLEPEMTLQALERGWLVYRYYFVRRWSASLRLKQLAWPEHHDFDSLLKSRNLRRMTAELVKTSTQFADLQAYLSGYAITGNRLKSLRVPAHLLTSEDDPIIPAGDLPRVADNERLTVVRTRHGGHCGFIDSLRGPSFADRYMLEQFERFDRQSASGAAR